MLYGLNDDRSDCAVACLAWQHETMKWEVLDRAVLQSTVEGWVWSVMRMLLEKISLTSTQVSEVGWARLARFTVIGQLPRGWRM